MTHPHICSSEQHTDLQHLPLKRKTICDDNSSKRQGTTFADATKTTPILDGTQSLDSDHSTEQSITPSSIDTTMKQALFYSSTTLESQLPPLPQVTRRAFRPCLLQGRTLQRSLTRHVAPDLPPTPEQSTTPRWHKQSYMLFLALRQHPAHAMPRMDLIKTALDLDKTISSKLNYPIVFGGKTPQNSASALLTNNHGRHFQPYRPSGSRTMYFRLAFEPADFDKAVTTYRQWMETLITKDWPLCFGKPLEMNTPFEEGSTLTTPSSSSPSSLSAVTSLSVAAASASSASSISSESSALSASSQPVSLSNVTDIHHPVTTDPSSTSPSIITTDSAISPPFPLLTEFDEFIATRQKERLQLKKLNRENENNKGNKTNGFKEIWDQYHLSPITSTKASFMADKMNFDGNCNNNNSNNTLYTICDSIPWKIQGDDDYEPTIKIPTCWQDIIYVRRGNRTDYDGGVYAQRRLPTNIPLGFYFGTPTVEDEFQLVKEEKAQSLDFCLMYGRTVLDATDDHGQPFTDPLKELDTIYCPFHFLRQADSSDMANVLFLKGKIYNQVICWTKRPIQQNEELMVWLKYE